MLSYTIGKWYEFRFDITLKPAKLVGFKECQWMGRHVGDAYSDNCRTCPGSLILKNGSIERIECGGCSEGNRFLEVDISLNSYKDHNDLDLFPMEVE